MNEDVTPVEEIEEQELENVAGGFNPVHMGARAGEATREAIGNFSNNTGNEGMLCTMTKECQNSCNG